MLITKRAINYENKDEIKLNPKILLIIPAYNEADGIEDVIRKVNDYRKNYGNLFIEFEDENSKRQNVLNHFSDVLSGSTFEKPYYLLYGFNSPTKDYVRYLIATKDLKGLKQLLYSPSPTARLISANALIYLKENYSEEENQKINEIIKNGQMIKGGVISCWTHKFDYNYYDVNKYFEKYFLMD